MVKGRASQKRSKACRKKMPWRHGYCDFSVQKGSSAGMATKGGRKKNKNHSLEMFSPPPDEDERKNPGR